mgnify:CR=1 FL=1
MARMRGLQPNDLRRGIMNAESDAAIEEANARVFQNVNGRKPNTEGRLENRNVKRKMNSNDTKTERTVIDFTFRRNTGALSENLKFTSWSPQQYPD